MATRAFAGFPAPFLRAAPDSHADPVQQLIWGDFVRFLGEEQGEWTKVRGRNRNGWIRRDELQTEQLLEVNFVDIGQGDGAFIVTPDDKFLLIDAGLGDNMYRFLSWRFNLPREAGHPIVFEKAVISHSDQDHYLGFDKLFESPDFKFDSVYHNGIVERAGPAGDALGPRTVASDGKRYLTDIVVDDQDLRSRLNDESFFKGKRYPTMLKGAADTGKVTEYRALSAADKFIPGYEEGHDLRIEVCGPVREMVNGAPAMRWFDNVAKTKNGHSVVLRLVYKDVRILLGGDLNMPSENYLLGHYSGRDPESDDEQELEAIVASTRPVFEADIAKACHHGSAEFTELFLRATNPIATVISSGDEESYAHPRPDALGATGKYGRGQRPLIFSTELARSTREFAKNMIGLDERISVLEQAVRDADTPEEKDRAQAALNRTLRNVAVYGLINLRTDGERVLMAYKLESPAPSGREWDTYRLVPDETGALTYLVD